jgi:TonB family protein
MTRVLLYQPSPRWRIGVAFGAAALVHFAAVTLASLHPQEKTAPPGGDSVPEITLITDVPPANSTPPPDVVDPPQILNPADTSMFPDERPTPAPVRRRTTRLAAPIVKNRNATIGSVGLSLSKASALNAPRPEYPYEARRQKITGNGIVIMTVDSASGNVTDVVMEASTGNSVLDNAAVTGFRRWRFKPGTASRVRCPITFTMTGAQY